MCDLRISTQAQNMQRMGDVNTQPCGQSIAINGHIRHKIRVIVVNVIEQCCLKCRDSFGGNSKPVETPRPVGAKQATACMNRMCLRTVHKPFAGFPDLMDLAKKVVADEFAASTVGGIAFLCRPLYQILCAPNNTAYASLGVAIHICWRYLNNGKPQE